jgi:TonB family protein
MRDKNKNLTSIDFLRYRRNEMSGEERNSFERELQKDPFAEEAADGFTSISPEETSKNIENLKKRLKSRIVRRQRYIYYRIAASVAVLLVISSIFIIINRSINTKLPAEIDIINEPLEIAVNQPIVQKPEEIVESGKPAMISHTKADRSYGQMQKNGAGTVIVPFETAKFTTAQRIDSIQPSGIKAADEYIVENLTVTPSAVNAMERSSSEFKVKGRIFSSEDNLPLPGASISIKGTNTGVITDAKGNFDITLPDTRKRTLIASVVGMESKEFEAKKDSEVKVTLNPAISELSEVVVVGYGSTRNDVKKEEVFTGYVPPQPVNGISSFNNYIRENIHRPDTTTSGQRVVVVVSFLVRTNGNIDSIRIVKSPGKPFSDEAIRLIKSMPSWKPAEENGKQIEDEVKVRIVFR